VATGTGDQEPYLNSLLGKVASLWQDVPKPALVQRKPSKKPPKADYLLDSLVFLCSHYGRPRSASVLCAGLPMHGGTMLPSLFLRAAVRQGFKAEALERPLTEIQDEVLPVVLILEGNKACVLTERQTSTKYSIHFPGEKKENQIVTREKLEKLHTGHVIYLKPVSALGSHSEAVSSNTPKAWFWATVKESWWTYIQVMIAAILINSFAIASPLFVMNVYDRVLPNNAVETGWVLAGGVATVFLLDFLLRNLRAIFIDHAGKRADVVIACRIFDHLLDMRLSHRPASAGSMASTMREFESVRDFFTSATLASFIDLPFAFVFVFVITLISWQVGILVLVAVFVVLIMSLFVQLPLARVAERALAQTEHKHGVLVEAINGLETIKVVGAAGRMRALWENLVGLTAETAQQNRFVTNLSVHTILFVQQFTTVAVVVAGIYLIQDGSISAGGLIAAVILTGRAIAPMSQVSHLMTRFHHARTSLEAIDSLMRRPVDRPTDRTFVQRPNLKGEIVLENVNFAYPETEYPVLRDLSVRIAPGERVGLVGRVGCGKTTLIKLIAGLYSPTSGTVSIDGTDNQQIEPNDLRSQIGYVPQDVFLFRGTVRENIAITDPHADDERIAEASRIVGLDRFINRHPLGYDLPVGERGDGLSGGQKQLISVARALLRKPKIFILDEPTSSTDTQTEALLMENLPAAIGDATLLLVTHRASLLKLVDRLIVFDQGKIVADGPRGVILEALASGRIASSENVRTPDGAGNNVLNANTAKDGQG